MKYNELEERVTEIVNNMEVTATLDCAQKIILKSKWKDDIINNVIRKVLFDEILSKPEYEIPLINALKEYNNESDSE